MSSPVPITTERGPTLIIRDCPTSFACRAAALLAAGLALGGLEKALPPPPRSLDAVASWAGEVGIEAAVVTSLFWIGIASASGLAILLLLTLVVQEVPRWARGTRPPFHPRLRHVAGLALTAVAGAAPPALAQPSSDPPATSAATEPVQRAWMVPLPSDGAEVEEGLTEMTTNAPEPTTPVPGNGVARMEQLPHPSAPPNPSVDEASPAEPVQPGELAAPGAGADSRDPVRSGAETHWLVAAGDHLWGIAEEALTDRAGSEPDLREIVGYWQDLIEVNRERLVDPGNPDLIYPGQVLVLPG